MSVYHSAAEIKVLMSERRPGRVVRAAWLWCRKSPYRASSRLGCAMRRLENSLSAQQKMGTFFELGKDKAAKGEGWAPLFTKIQWDSNPHCPYGYWAMGKRRKENPQKLTQLGSRSHPRHLMGKRTAQKDTMIDITSDSQVNSNFPYRWSPASLTFNNYFYLFLYLYITRISVNNNTPHLKSPKKQNRRAALGRPAIKITRGLQTFFYFFMSDLLLART